jgi:undecaprenyl pyrophosphate synthase
MEVGLERGRFVLMMNNSTRHPTEVTMLMNITVAFLLRPATFLSIYHLSSRILFNYSTANDLIISHTQLSISPQSGQTNEG